MWVSEIAIRNIRGFRDASLQLSKGINLLVGPNNSGKSTILKCVSMLQKRDELSPSDITLGESTAIISLSFEGQIRPYLKGVRHPKKVTIDFPGGEFKLHGEGDSTGFRDIPQREPLNFIYPFLSKRKVVKYQETVNSEHAETVTGNFENLYSKIDRISNAEFLPAYTDYTGACDHIIGFRVTCTSTSFLVGAAM